jgi:thiol-disulfide isomerase/thioredoxin
MEGFHLENTDFNQNGGLNAGALRVLQSGKQNKPVIVMIQGSYCGHCKSAVPEFLKLANDNDVAVACVQIDSELPSEKAVSNITKMNDPDFAGVPSYHVFNSNGSFMKVHNGDRTASALKRSALGIN